MTRPTPERRALAAALRELADDVAAGLAPIHVVDRLRALLERARVVDVGE